MDFLQDIGMLILFFLFYALVFIYGIFMLLMPIFVYKMKKQIDKIEFGIEKINADVDTLITISTLLNNEITDKNKNT